MTAFEQCIRAKAARFLVRDDATVLLEPQINGPLQVIEADASLYLVEVASTGRYERRMVDSLVPEAFRGAWRLGMQKQDGYTVFTPYNQTLPNVLDLLPRAT